MDDLPKLSAEALRQRFAATVLLHERTQHVGRANRIFKQIREIGERLVALGGASERELLPLLHHPSGKVRRSAAFDIRPFNRDLFMSVMQGLIREGGEIGREAQSSLAFLELQTKYEAAPDAPDPPPNPNWLRIINWQKANPPPRGMSRNQFQDRVSTEFSPDRARQILALARLAIGLWPQDRAADSPHGSRHCGPLWAPPGWQWPIYQEEPMYFLGQIDCSNLSELPGADSLPREGLLAFFGDFDAIAGCDMAGSAEQGAVYHWPTEGLIATEPPLPLDHSEEQKATAVTFRPFIDLPHPFSHAIAELSLSDEEVELYQSLRDALVKFGIPDDVVDYCDLDSKLLGWPNLVQSEDVLPPRGEGTLLQLVQLPARLGPGGSLYFLIQKDDLSECRFDRCILDAQNT